MYLTKQKEILTIIVLLCDNDFASEKPKTVIMKKLFYCENAFFFLLYFILLLTRRCRFYIVLFICFLST